MMRTGQHKQQIIREAAYRKWEQAGRPSGEGVEFWLQAEREYQQHERESPATDIVQLASEESFPASDAPAWIPITSDGAHPH